MQPYDYTIRGISNPADSFDYTIRGISNPADSFMAGLKQTINLQDLQAQRNAAKEQYTQAQEARYQQEIMGAEMAKLANSPSVEGINRIMAMYPSIADKYKPLLESLTEQQKQARIRQAIDIYAPMVSGRKDIAIDNINTQAEAAKNAGDEQSLKSLGIMKKLIESPDTGEAGDNIAMIGIGTFLSAAMGEKEFAKTFEALGKEKREGEKAPAELSIKQSEAKIKANLAKGTPAPEFVHTSEGIAAWNNETGKLELTGYQPKPSAPGVSVNLGTPQFAVEESTGQQVIYQPSPSGEARIIRGLRPVTEQTKESGKESAKMEKLSSVINIARKTLDEASGSYLGAGAAQAQRIVGVSSAKTKANSKLKALQAAMMMNMPRMEGPQSDRDVELYREQAGRIGDPTVPIDDRKAALDAMIELMDKYRSGKPQQSKPSGTTQRNVTVDY